MSDDKTKPCCGLPEHPSTDCCPSGASSQVEKTSSCGSDCCAPAIGSSSRWKTLVFLLVMGAAVAVLAHGLAKRPGKTSEADRRSFAAAMSKAEDPAGAAPALCGLALASVASLDSVAADKEAVFILLPGDSKDSAQDASLLVEATVTKLSSKGKRVAAFTLEKTADDYGRLVRQFSITSLPGVVVAGRGCGATAVWGDVTETKLLSAFISASTPSSSCGPSKCGPAGCK